MSASARARGAGALFALAGLSAGPLRAQEPAVGVLSPGRVFSEQGGASLYANVCAGCHMADGRGAVGAAAYPSLAGDGKLAVSAYPVAVVANGLRSMPAVGRKMTDEQVAAVVNFVRGHFGNEYGDAVTAAEVKGARR